MGDFGDFFNLELAIHLSTINELCTLSD
uniref:Uncharacterized protein n=1 Tax=Anguilla anguilla TaxID=7936 RepID=A0A0E9UIA9_ANGAN